MNVRKRMSMLLFIGFGFVSLLLGVVASSAVVTIFTLRDSNAVVYQQLTQAELARSLQYEIVAANHARDDYFAGPHLKDRDAAMQRYQQYTQNIVYIERSLRSSALTKTGVIALAIFDNQWALYLKQNSLVFKIFNNGNVNFALDARSSPNDVLNTLDTFVAQAILSSDKARSSAVQISALGSTWTVIICGVAILVGVLSAWLLARGITRIADRLALSLEEVRQSHDALENANARLETLATMDPLTGLPNHRALVTCLDQELESARHGDKICSLLFLDLDHFKTINDSYGHHSGDTVLRELATIVRPILRPGDTLGRWGGEEFIAVFPETDGEGAVIVGERIREAVASHIFPVGGGLHMTCSIGVASYTHEALPRDELVAAADHAMYAAKRMGRNQVRASKDPAVNAMQVEQGGSSSREEMVLMGVVEALSTLVEARDQYTGEHTDAVGKLTMEVALEMGLDVGDAHMLQIAGRLHDIGKIAIPDTILHKPGKLTGEEWGIIRTHPVVGAKVVSLVPPLRGLAPIIRAHHERWDGKGYPDALKNEAIPLGARIISVVDAYEAITTNRPYSSARDAYWALRELQSCTGSQFDAKVVAALERVLTKNDLLTRGLNIFPLPNFFSVKEEFSGSRSI